MGFLFEMQQVESNEGTWKITLFNWEQYEAASWSFTDEPTECLGLDAFPQIRTVEECKKACNDQEIIDNCRVYQWTDRCMMGLSWDCTGSAQVLEGGRKDRFVVSDNLGTTEWYPDSWEWEATTIKECDADRDVYFLLFESEESFATQGSFKIVIDQDYNCTWLDDLVKLLTAALIIYIVAALSCLLLCVCVVVCVCCGVCACCCSTPAQKTVYVQQPQKTVLVQQQPVVQMGTVAIPVQY